jgi:hypothetical protein
VRSVRQVGKFPACCKLYSDGQSVGGICAAELCGPPIGKESARLVQHLINGVPRVRGSESQSRGTTEDGELFGEVERGGGSERRWQEVVQGGGEGGGVHGTYDDRTMERDPLMTAQFMQRADLSAFIERDSDQGKTPPSRFCPPPPVTERPMQDDEGERGPRDWAGLGSTRFN